MAKLNPAFKGYDLSRRDVTLMKRGVGDHSHERLAEHEVEEMYARFHAELYRDVGEPHD